MSILRFKNPNQENIALMVLVHANFKVPRERLVSRRVTVCLCSSLQHWKKYDIHEKQSREETDSVVLIENLKKVSQ